MSLPQPVTYVITISKAMARNESNLKFIVNL